MIALKIQFDLASYVIMIVLKVQDVFASIFVLWLFPRHPSETMRNIHALHIRLTANERWGAGKYSFGMNR